MDRESNRKIAFAAIGLVFGRLNQDMDATYKWFRSVNQRLGVQPAQLIELGQSQIVVDYLMSGGQ